jgi:hypothetical protein
MDSSQNKMMSISELQKSYIDIVSELEGSIWTIGGNIIIIIYKK